MNKRRLKSSDSRTKILIASVVGIFSLIAVPCTLTPIFAQSSISPVVEENLIDPSGNVSAFELTAIPPRLEITGKPGETLQKTIKVRNGTKSTQQISTLAEDFIVDSDGKTPIPVNPAENLSDRYSLASWLTVSPAKFSLRPTQTQVMDVLIQIPNDALPGGHYAMVLHEKAGTLGNNPTDGGSEGSASIASRVGTLIYLTVEGPVNEEAFVRNLKVPNFQEYGPVPVAFEVENRSDIHIRPLSSLEVYDMFGQKVFTSKVDEKNIFPFTVREFQTGYEAYWGLGRYTAKIITSYGTQGSVTKASAHFWIVPYKLMIMIAVLILTAVALWIAIRRHIHHRKDAKTQEIEYLKKKVEELEKR